MVKVLAFLCILPLILFSGEFVASVDTNQVSMGDTFVLNLTLKDASATAHPNIDSLAPTFKLHSQQQSQKTFIENGKVTVSRVWSLVLIPQVEGILAIPSFTIETSEGTLSSKPLSVTVAKETAQTAEIKTSVELSKTNPYKNEPFILKFRVLTKVDLANLKIDKLEADNAIIEVLGSKTSQELVEGVYWGVVDYSYQITPLKAGELKIPPIHMQGVIPIKRKADRGFFNDDFFTMMQGYSQLKPFSLESDSLTLTIQPAREGVKPWLPASALTIEEIWSDDQTFKVGEPFTRGFKIAAQGVKALNLPSLNDLHAKESLFKSYVDKPEINEELKDYTLNSFKKETLTLIPQQAGDITLPEIVVAWWDVTKNEKAYAKVPARTLHISPGVETVNDVALAETSLSLPQSSEQKTDNTLLYTVIAGMGLILMGVVTWGIYLQKKIVYLSKGPEQESPVTIASINEEDKYAPKKESETKKGSKLPDLNPT